MAHHMEDIAKKTIESGELIEFLTPLADRHNQNKTRWALVDFASLKPMVDVLEYGAKKYSDDNWMKGLPTREVCESLMRHLFSYLEGNDVDEESGLPEVGHILCNAMFLSHMALFRQDMDNRRKHLNQSQP